MITAVTGLPGAGKTLFLTWLIGQYVRAGRLVATNIELTARCPYAHRVARLDDAQMLYPVFDIVESPRDGYQELNKGEWFRAFWHYMPPGWVYVISEADNYWDSMDYGKASKDSRLYFKQHRKRKDDIVLDFQNVDNQYNRVRRMVQKWVVCEYSARSSRFWSMLPQCTQRFLRSEYGHESFAPQYLMGDGYFSMKEAREMFSWYNSDQLYGSPENYKWGGVTDGNGKSCGVDGGSVGRVGERGRPGSDGASPPVVA